MSTPHIDGSLSDADFAAIRAALDTISSKLPFLVALDAGQRQSLYKMGDKSVAFVEEAGKTAKNHPTVFPPSFDAAAFARDVALSARLRELQSLTDALAVKVSDTAIAVGSEAMTGASTVYGYVQAAAKTEPGLRSVADDLGERFKKAPRQKPPADPPTK